jgi:hypothetical protein
MLGEVREEAVMKTGQSTPSLIAGVSRPRVLVDTNVWRYLIDLDALETVYRVAKSANSVILACPAVLYEMLRLEDAPLRQRLVKAICRSRWVRMMPEAFEESEDFKAEIGRLRPQWLLRDVDRSMFNRLYNDWNGPRGVWWRARVDPSLASAVLRAVEGNDLDRGRSESRELRAQIGGITTFEKVKLDRWTATLPLNPPGWDGRPVEMWRAEAMRFYITALLVSDGTQSPATREWLESWIDLPSIRNNLSSFAKFFLYETDTSHLPREWLRWAFRTLQATRKVSPGTPVDNQIGSYLVDADIFMTADKIFVSIIERIAAEAVVRIATPALVSMENCVQKLVEALTEESPS